MNFFFQGILIYNSLEKVIGEKLFKLLKQIFNFNYRIHLKN